VDSVVQDRPSRLTRHIGLVVSGFGFYDAGIDAVKTHRGRKHVVGESRRRSLTGGHTSHMADRRSRRLCRTNAGILRVLERSSGGIDRSYLYANKHHVHPNHTTTRNVLSPSSRSFRIILAEKVVPFVFDIVEHVVVSRPSVACLRVVVVDIRSFSFL
jgi:hypothetical protein